MEVKIIDNRDEMDGFAAGQEYGQFLQSWEWGEFQEQVGNKVIRIGAMDNGELAAVATLIKKPLFAGYNYYYCPRGPIFKNYDLRFKIFNLLIKEVKNIAIKENIIFMRYEPEFINHESGIINRLTIDIQPSKTLLLDLSKTEKELLAEMHQKTRYNIRLAEKKGVVAREAVSGDFENFWKLMETTRDRDGFRLHGKEYYEKMLEGDNRLIKLFIAEYQGKMLAGNIISFFGDTATYVHGASGNEDREMMAPYALQWHIIKLAKSQGNKYYDFYGIDEKKWPGVTRFKKGFGGFEKEYPGTYDLVFNSFLYRLYKFLRTVRRAM